MLNDDEAQKLRLTFTTGGWNDVIKPALVRRRGAIIEALLQVPGRRGADLKEVSDDYLRAAAQECEWMLTFWENEVRVFDVNRRMDELRRQDGAGQEVPVPTPANP